MHLMAKESKFSSNSIRNSLRKKGQRHQKQSDSDTPLFHSYWTRCLNQRSGEGRKSEYHFPAHATQPLQSPRAAQTILNCPSCGLFQHQTQQCFAINICIVTVPLFQIWYSGPVSINPRISFISLTFHSFAKAGEHSLHLQSWYQSSKYLKFFVPLKPTTRNCIGHILGAVGNSHTPREQHTPSHGLKNRRQAVGEMKIWARGQSRIMLRSVWMGPELSTYNL